MTITETAPRWDRSNRDLLANDPMPLPNMHRAQVCWAIRAAARANRGIVSAGTWREYLPEAVNPKLIGGVINSLRESDALVWTGRYVPSGNVKSGNANRPVFEWRVTDIEAVK